ncbi:MORN repeat domain containing protein [Theileria equi strain WA]|uniref:MORN repeat domain containing protein n=1 Tax=Theileria equi strain WA TaxID=1537102 RepID=L0AXP0_THEEQ|nr:MORN repeat domain containing protein [Theileria equi strain WA]AFZ80330.1 MORN repeat domain containing protein [Theileria equi strain WA]|eukprot:XP_004829996.1 MORN repeat domain containing protein [Theileria equi strain WA]
MEFGQTAVGGPFRHDSIASQTETKSQAHLPEEVTSEECTKPEDPIYQNYYNNLYNTSDNGPPILSSFIVKQDHGIRKICFEYPEQPRIDYTWKNENLQFSDDCCLYGSQRDYHAELASCYHLIPELALGSCKPNSLIDFVYFVMPTFSGNLLYGISYVAKFTNNEENVMVGISNKEAEQGDSSYFVAICVISKVPFFGAIGSRLECIAQTYFNSNRMEDASVLSSFVDHMNATDLVEEWNYESLYFNIESYFKPCPLSFSYRGLFFMLKCILSEQRIAIYSESAARSSSCILSFLSLIPGSSSFNFNSTGFASLWHSWKQFGLPLRLFHSKNVVLPFFTPIMTDLLDDCNGYLIGITDMTIVDTLKHPPTILFDMEEEVIRLRSKSLLGFYAPSFYEQGFFPSYEIFEEFDSDAEEDDDDPLKQIAEASDTVFGLLGDYLSKAPTAMVDIGGKAKRMMTIGGRYNSASKTRENSLRLFEMYFPGALPKFLRQFSKSKKDKSEKLPETVVVPPVEKVETPEPLTIQKMFDSMYKKDGKYRYFGYTSYLKQDDNDNDRIREAEYVINTRVRPLQDYFLKFLKAAAYVAGKDRSACKLVMDFSFDLDSIVDYSMPVDGFYFKRGDFFFRGEARTLNPSDDEDKPDSALKEDKAEYVDVGIEGDVDGKPDIPKPVEKVSRGEEVVETIPSLLASSIMEFQTNHSLDFIELWLQKPNAASFLVNHSLETFNEPTFILNQNVAKYTYPNGDIYIGELTDMLRNGHGSYISVDGSRYDGEWRRDRRHGKGTLIYKESKYKYTGDWYLDKRHGYGTLETADFEYVGEFKFNRYHGNGTLTKKDGTKLEGEFRRGKFNGRGIMTLPDGSVKMGTFKNNEIVGICSYIDVNGRAYVGRLYGDAPDGPGSLRYDQNLLFEGFWNKGKRCKQGTITIDVSDGKITIEGTWEDDKMSFKDVMITFPSGYKYNGDIVYLDSPPLLDSLEPEEQKPVQMELEKLQNHLLPHGRGVCKTPNGGVYNGFFKYGFRFGSGSQVFENGVIYNGSWRLGRFDGNATIQFPNNDVINLSFSNGVLKTLLTGEEYWNLLQDCLREQRISLEQEFTQYKLDIIKDIIGIS